MARFNTDYGGGFLWLNYVASTLALALYNILGFSRKTVKYALVCLGQDTDLGAIETLPLLIDKDKYLEDYGEEKSYDIHEMARDLYSEYQRKSPNTRKHVFSNFRDALTSHIKMIKTRALESNIELQLQQVAEMLEFSELEVQIIRLLNIFRIDTYDPDKYIDGSASLFDMVNRPLLSRILNATPEDIAKALRGKLLTLDIIEKFEHSNFMLGDTFFAMMESPGDLDALSKLITVKPPKLSESDFFVSSQTLNLIKGLIQNDSPTPTHILIHGPAGVGKTEFARTIAASAGVRAYEVTPDNRLEKHRANLILARAMARRENGGLLIVDEAEELLNLGQDPLTNFFSGMFGGRSTSKSWINAYLDTPGSKCLWIVNNAQHLEKSIARRFTFSLCFPELGRRERTKIWRTSKAELADIGSDILTDPSLEKLAAEQKISPAIINQCFRKSLEAGSKDEKTFVGYATQMINAHKKLTGSTFTKVSLPASYRAEFLNINPPVVDLVRRLKDYVAINRDSPENEREGLKFLFHGVPGTGKTKLAYYLAKELDLELIHGNVSELLSCYYGETEAKLAFLFEQATAVGGLLLIDEIDTFLSARDDRSTKFLVSVTNEFLVCLERYQGLFIGATNRFGSLDQAAIRRFTAKIEFKPLAPESRQAFFENFFKPMTGCALTEPEKLRLMSLPSLTPGDFSNVAAWAKWFTSDLLDNFGVIDKLAEEVAIREKAYTPFSPHVEEVSAPEIDDPNKPKNTIN
ncbi:MAG: ATP-binding protein [Deltaproteobacteria bacterium]|jgi:Holliday junction resolvasome RuvABC ATP-dependent DNA helicase subunit|nr:ATP-binding protein [Deltaproteobacteria bacterium]